MMFRMGIKENLMKKNPRFLHENCLAVIILYSLSWILKIVFELKLKKMTKIGFTTEKFINKLNLQRKIHLAIFNIAILDIGFYGVRTLAHTKNTPIQKLYTLIFLGLAGIDLMEILFTSSSITHSEIKTVYLYKDPQELKNGEKKIRFMTRVGAMKAVMKLIIVKFIQITKILRTKTISKKKKKFFPRKRNFKKEKNLKISKIPKN